jgi:23S rRNA pseudouridine1911/1915/1917 synthase
MKSGRAKAGKTGPRTFKVGQRDLPVKLIEFLENRLGLSRRKSKEHIDARRVFVNDQCVWMARHKLSGGDNVAVIAAPLPRKTPDFTFLYEDEDFLIVDKPAGLLSNETDSIEAQLRKSLSSSELTTVHRLDRWTSGCLLMAKTAEAVSVAVVLFRKHLLEKRYHALVVGRLSPESQKITTPIDGRRAVTHVRSLDGNRSASHVTIKTDTGRTHQIRKHLTSINHPVLGDRHYMRTGNADQRLMQVSRLMLHASALAFRHPRTQRQVRATCALPRDFRSCMKLFDLS